MATSRECLKLENGRQRIRMVDGMGSICQVCMLPGTVAGLGLSQTKDSGQD